VAEKHIANAEAKWRAICVLPDFCKVGAVVPFDSFRDLSPYLKASPNVNARGTPVYPLTGIIGGTKSNAGSGVVSQVAKMPGNVVILADSTTVNVNGLPSARHDSIVLMNVSPIGPNTVGKLTTDQGGPLGVSLDQKIPCNDPPKSSPQLETLQKTKEQLKGMDPSQLDEYVRFGDLNKALDGGISNIDIKDEGGWSTAGNVAAQGTRAVVGFAKDIVVGIGQLAYAGAKLMTPGGQIHAQLDMAILMEHIRLGNVCLQTLKDAAERAGHELAKPVTDAWDKGSRVEAVTRAGLEIGSLLLIIGDLAKLAQVGKVAEAAKISEAAKIAEAEKVTEANKAADAAKAAEAQKAADGTNGVKIKKQATAKRRSKPRQPGPENKNIDHSKTAHNPDGSTTYFDKQGDPVTYKDGYPDFKPYAEADVNVTGLKGSIPPDDAIANRAAGLRSTPDGYTWHHVEGGTRMQLIPTEIHSTFPHTGGASDIRYGGG